MIRFALALAACASSFIVGSSALAASAPLPWSDNINVCWGSGPPACRTPTTLVELRRAEHR
jgi:hypothetical protein